MCLLLRVTPRWGRRSAVSGAVVWLLFFAFEIGDSRETATIQRICLFGFLVIVPLALSLIASEKTNDNKEWLYRSSLLAQPVAALSATVSFLFEPGWWAAILALPWVIVTGLMALLGLTRITQPQLNSPPEFSIDSGLIFIPVAGFWFFVSRLGIQFLGFGDTIILLTAVHFTFAAYAAPIIAGLSGRKLMEQGNDVRLFTFVPFGIAVGTPLVAAGITFSPVIGLVGTLLISVALVLLAVLVIGKIVPKLNRMIATVLLIISALSSGMAMVLACIYAYSIVARKLVFDIPQMAKTHGILNSFGFTLCALLAWSIIQSYGSTRNKIPT